MFRLALSPSPGLSTAPKPPGLGPNFLARGLGRPEFWQEPARPNIGRVGPNLHPYPKNTLTINSAITCDSLYFVLIIYQ